MVFLRRHARHWGAYATFGLASAFLFAAAPLPHAQPTHGGSAPPTNCPAPHKDPQESFWEKTTTDPVAVYTGLLAVFTFALVSVSAVQITYLIKADNRAAAADNRAVEAEKRIASAAALAEKQLDLSEKQFLLTAKQADLSEKQHGLAREQFFAQHRPRLLLKDVFFERGQLERLTFELVNVGGSNAYIVGGFVAMGFVDDPRQFKDSREVDLDDLMNAQFSAGQLRQFSRPVPDEVQKQLTKMNMEDMFPDSQKIVNLDSPNAGGRPVFFFGSILYADGRGEEFGVTRLSVMRRRLTKHLTFERTGVPDHEYAD